MKVEWDRVRNVLLDLGGVILRIDYQRTIDAYKALGFEGFDAQYSKMQQSGLFDKLETGHIDREQYVAAVREVLPQASASDIILAWNAMLLDFPPGRIETVRAISSAFPTCLLSNTNAIHYEAFSRTLRETTDAPSIQSLFEQAFLSHEIGMRKPHAETFVYVLKQMKWKPEETLFVDDSPQHVDGALSVGMQAYHLIEPERLEDLFAPVLA